MEKAAEAGIDIFLIFDALQDLRNCETAFRAVKKAGKKIEGSVQYNISPFHTTKVFVENALEQEQMGASLMHVEDMAGLKIRVNNSQMQINLFTAMGADPLNMNFSEVFTSLQQGSIDGQETPIDVT